MVDSLFNLMVKYSLNSVRRVQPCKWIPCTRGQQKGAETKGCEHKDGAHPEYTLTFQAQTFDEVTTQQHTATRPRDCNYTCNIVDTHVT